MSVRLRRWGGGGGEERLGAGREQGGNLFVGETFWEVEKMMGRW